MEKKLNAVPLSSEKENPEKRDLIKNMVNERTDVEKQKKAMEAVVKEKEALQKQLT